MEYSYLSNKGLWIRMYYPEDIYNEIYGAENQPDLDDFQDNRDVLTI